MTLRNSTGQNIVPSVEHLLQRHEGLSSDLWLTHKKAGAAAHIHSFSIGEAEDPWGLLAEVVSFKFNEISYLQ